MQLLQAGFTDDNVFVDVQQKAGTSFVEQIERAGGACHVLIAVVGPRWLATPDEAGRRPGDPENRARREIEAAIERDVAVIPVLVAGAVMPDLGEVPESLTAFASTHALKVEPGPGGYDRLVARLDEVASGDRHRQDLQRAAAEPVVRWPGGLLDEIKDKLDDGRSGAAVVAIVGLPAHGKTQLAVEYAHRHSDDYQIVWESPLSSGPRAARHSGRWRASSSCPCDTTSTRSKRFERRLKRRADGC